MSDQAPPTSAKGEDEPDFATSNALGPSGKPLKWYKWAAWFANECWRSGLLPEQIKTGPQAFTILCKGEELGLPPFAAWSWIYLTKARKLAIMSKGALAVVQAKPAFGGYREWIEGEGTPQMKGVAAATRKGFPEYVKEFSLADAEKAGLLAQRRTTEGREYTSTWQAYDKDMLLSRARGRVLDIAFAAELGGIDVEGVAEDKADAILEREGKRGRRADEDHRFTMLPGSTEPKALPAPKIDPLVAAISATKLEVQPVPVATGRAVETTPVAAPRVAPPPAGRRREKPAGSAPAVALPPPVVEIDPSAVTVVEDAPPPKAPARTPPAPKPTSAVAKTPPAPTNCGRCGAKLNAIGGCDVCGWPQELDLR